MSIFHTKMKCFSALVFVLLMSSVSFGLRHSVHYEGESEVLEGEKFRIVCVMSRQDVPGWTLNSSVVITEDNDLGYNVQEREKDAFHWELSLSAEEAQLHHSGEYRCNKYSRDFHSLYIKPRFEEDREESEISDHKKDNEYKLIVNESYEFYCSSAQDDDTPVTWYKNGRRLVEHSESNIVLSGASLLVEYAQEDDAGEYVCTVDTSRVDGISGIGRFFHLNSAARIVQFPERANIENGTLHLYCEAQGFPLPEFTWYKDNEDIHEIKKRNDRLSIYTFRSGGRPSSTLRMDYVTEQDKGLYICRVHNSIDSGTESDEESVFVHGPGDMIVTNEEEPGMGKLLTPGEPLILQCSTSDCPQCKIIWQRNGEPLSSIDNHIEIHDKNNSVVIKSATYNDTGVYICGITHGDLSISVNATIVVQSKIKLDRFDASSVVIEGSPLELICHPQGSPAPNIKWFIGNQEVFDDDERVELLEHGGLAKGRLLIQEAEYSDRNHYTCEAFNQLDRVNTTVFIRIKDKLAALWPFLGICAEVLILCSIIFIYEEKKRKNSNDEPETDLPTENKHHREQRGKGQDVRQRK
ncbi:neuroplastin [Parasteatoda tepidariorum]|uniref:neuroplastin n=1 Tax=Parasteatoda tepidariorum TaxID=114398 RepID=UPI001C72278D|nr:neuroplastin [Parasteatoda tepidariorum]